MNINNKERNFPIEEIENINQNRQNYYREIKHDENLKANIASNNFALNKIEKTIKKEQEFNNYKEISIYSNNNENNKRANFNEEFQKKNSYEKEYEYYLNQKKMQKNTSENYFNKLEKPEFEKHINPKRFEQLSKQKNKSLENNNEEIIFFTHKNNQQLELEMENKFLTTQNKSIEKNKNIEIYNKLIQETKNSKKRQKEIKDEEFILVKIKKFLYIN